MLNGWWATGISATSGNAGYKAPMQRVVIEGSAESTSVLRNKTSQEEGA